MIGEIIQDRYHIEQLLGEGGFGAVYKAMDRKFDREIAIKLLNQSVKSNSDHAQRFITEAKVTSQLSHRNIPVVYDFGESKEGQLFIATELFRGASLEEVIDHVYPSPRQASWVVNEVNEALIMAHQKGITHRDVKPPNIFVHDGSSGEEIKLLDFGIAKLNNHQSHTLTGQLFGTPYFMAPEQILGQKNISPATDLYSLGAVLFYCLTRTVPYDGDSQFMIFNKHVNAATPKIKERSPHLDQPRLQELIDHLMEKNPENRPSNAYEAREIFAEIEYLTTQIDPDPRERLLSTYADMSADSGSITSEIATPIIGVDTPVELIPSLPRPFAVSKGFYNNEDAGLLSDIQTLPPIDDHWRPTAKLDLNDIESSLLDDDDTTDNIKRSSREETISLFSTPPPSITDSPTQLSIRPGYHSTSSNDSDRHSFDRQDLAFFNQEIDEVTGTLVKSSRSHRPIVLSLVFLVGIVISLFSFNIDSGSDKKSNQSEKIVSLEISRSVIKSTSVAERESSIEGSLPLPQTIKVGGVQEVSNDQDESSTLLLPDKRLPLPSMKKATKTKPSTKNKQHARTKSKRPKRYSTKLKSRKKSKSSAKKIEKRKADTSLFAAKMRLRVTPRKASYMMGDQVRLKASPLTKGGAPVNIERVYLLKNLETRKVITLTKSILKLKLGTWTLKACTTGKSKVCSQSVKLIVYDPSSIIDLDD